MVTASSNTTSMSSAGRLASWNSLVKVGYATRISRRVSRLQATSVILHRHMQDQITALLAMLEVRRFNTM